MVCRSLQITISTDRVKLSREKAKKWTVYFAESRVGGIPVPQLPGTDSLVNGERATTTSPTRPDFSSDTGHILKAKRDIYHFWAMLDKTVNLSQSLRRRLGQGVLCPWQIRTNTSKWHGNLRSNRRFQKCPKGTR